MSGERECVLEEGAPVMRECVQEAGGRGKWPKAGAGVSRGGGAERSFIFDIRVLAIAGQSLAVIEAAATLLYPHLYNTSRPFFSEGLDGVVG